MSIKPCADCGADFDALGPQARCTDCRTSVCPTCGATFLTTRRGHKYCSYACSGRADANVARLRQMRRPDVSIGARFGRLTVVEISPDRQGRDGKTYAMATCRCECGVQKDVYQSNLRRGLSQSCGCLARERTAEAHRQLRAEIPTYKAIHHRVKQDRGKANRHTCPCGEPAAEWAYDNDDPDEVVVTRTDPATGRQRVERLSSKVDHYIAMCVPCHRRFDAQHRAKRREVQSA